MKKKNVCGFSHLFDSFNVYGDKILIHKSVINSAIKRVKANGKPFENEYRIAGRLDVLEELLEAIDIGMSKIRNRQ